jgi:L-asparaginase II
MSNPVLVELLRGSRVETVHRGSIAVMDADGALVLALGDIDMPVFPRSAVKAIQALPLIETGAADQFGLTDAEIALACSSHMGEDMHVETAHSMLAKAGLTPDALECGSHWPSNSKATRRLAAQGQKPTALHNNCSGKHAGFICAACASGMDAAGYVQAKHPLQNMVREAMVALTGAVHDSADCGIDGCSIPTYAVPLRALALGFARFATGVGMDAKRQAAAARIRRSMAAAPLMLSGTGKFDSDVPAAFKERVIAKVGAEGVYCGAFPELGLGVAIKCDDGSMPAAEIMMAAMINRFVTKRSEAEEQGLAPLRQRNLVNWNGITVGEVRPAEAIR